MTAVVFNSFYGSTRRYAAELAVGLEAELIELERAETQACLDALAADASPLIVLSPVHGPAVAGASFLAKHDFGARPTAMVAVGMTLLPVVRAKDPLAGPLGDKPFIERFYVPGSLNYSELSAAHTAALKAINAALRLKPVKSDNDCSMLAMEGKDTDRVDFTELEPIVEWARRNGA